MTIDEMKKLKIEYGLTGEMIAQRSGVPLGTVQKVFAGVTNAPRKQTLDALEGVFAEEALKRSRRRYDFSEPSSDVVREPVGNYNVAEKERLYTIDDYYALPDEVRAELIDGRLYTMLAPTTRHQAIIGELYLLFRQCADVHDSSCSVFLSPCDVRLDRDIYTMVQPDLLVVCNSDSIESLRIEGAPDLVVEVLSPSTRMKDISLKLYKYMNAGVREYWVVDSEKRQVTVHHFEAEDYFPERYEFTAKVPIHISGGECGIDFTKVLKQLERYGW